MSRETEQIAWKSVAGLLVFLQLITLSFCGYIVTKIDHQGDEQAQLTQRVAVVESRMGNFQRP